MQNIMKKDKETGKIKQPALSINNIITKRPDNMSFIEYREVLKRQKTILKSYLKGQGITKKQTSNKYLPITQEKKKFINNCSSMENNRRTRRFKI